jgi:effector-binding domain-containing protein
LKERAVLTLPKIVDRPAQPYVAIRRTVKLPFGEVIDTTLPKLWTWIGDHRVEPAGPPFFKYNRIDMATELEIEFGAPTTTLLQPDDLVVTGTLPAGKYATLTYHGHYDKLVEVTGVLLGWAMERGLKFDMEATPQGDVFASRLEIYPNDPREVTNPDDWETVLMFKLAD